MQCGHYIATQCGLTAAETPVLLGDLGASSGVAWTLMHSDDTHVSALTTADLMKVATLDCQVHLRCGITCPLLHGGDDMPAHRMLELQRK